MDLLGFATGAIYLGGCDCPVIKKIRVDIGNSCAYFRDSCALDEHVFRAILSPFTV